MEGAIYGAHGHVFTLDVEDKNLRTRVQNALSTLRLSTGIPKDDYVLDRRDAATLGLRFGSEEIGARYSEDDLLLLLHWHINQRVIALASQRWTTLHAAAARSQRGVGLLLPAPMESGKTTTVTGLLRAGWDFLTDEAAAVDPAGVVRGYPKPLTIDRGSWPLFPDLEPDGVADTAGSWLVPATRTGAQVAERATVRLIVFPAYAAGRETTLTTMSPSDAALELAHSTFHFDSHGERDLRCVSSLARNVPAYRLTVGNLSAAVQKINQLEAKLAVEP